MDCAHVCLRVIASEAVHPGALRNVAIFLAFFGDCLGRPAASLLFSLAMTFSFLVYTSLIDWCIRHFYFGSVLLNPRITKKRKAVQHLALCWLLRKFYSAEASLLRMKTRGAIPVIQKPIRP